MNQPDRSRNINSILAAADKGLTEDKRRDSLPQRKARLAMVHRTLVDNHGQVVRMVSEMYQFGLGWDFVYAKEAPSGYRDLGVITYLGYDYYVSMYYDGFNDEGPKEAPNPGDFIRRV